MKRYLIFIVALSLFIFGMYMVIKILKKKEKLDQAIIEKQSLPNFNFYNLKGQLTNNGFIKKDVPVCIIYFNTSCEHCQFQAREMRKNDILFKKAQVVMISFNSVKEINKFINEYELNDSSINFLCDRNYEFYKWFGKSSIPSTFIYSSRHKLIKEYHGAVKINDILKYI